MMGRCFLCDPPTDVPDDQMHEHLLTEHELDAYEAAEKWPDGEVVVHDETLEPKDFGS